MPTPQPIAFPGEERSNAARRVINETEPYAMRTFTPSQAVFGKSAGAFHWTPEGRRLYDFSSGVLVSNLGHNPHRWMQRFAGYMGWRTEHLFGAPAAADEYFEASTLTAYNGVTELEATTTTRLLANVGRSAGSGRLDGVMWAASGSEAIQKALWACLARDTTRDMIIATRYGFHGKKGLSCAITGSETDSDRDPRVKFISFPMESIADHSDCPGGLATCPPAASAANYPACSRCQAQPGSHCPVDLVQVRVELDALWHQFGRRLTCVITEPYLGGGGSFHPPAAYHRVLQDFCRERDLLLVFDEVQANFGRTGTMYAFEAYGVEPDFVVLGKGLGNGVPVAAVVGRRDIMRLMKYGAVSDTWSANPLSCAAILATLDEFESRDVLGHTRQLTPVFLAGLDRLKETGLIRHVRGEGLVFGIECAAAGGLTPGEVAAAIVEACYLGEKSAAGTNGHAAAANGHSGANGDGIHLLGALSGKVLRVSPPLTITLDEAQQSLDLMYRLVAQLARRLGTRPAAASGVETMAATR